MTATIVSLDRATPEHVAKRVGDLFTDSQYRKANHVITSWSGFEPSPLLRRDDIASRLGVGSLFVKDEADRLALKSFKSLGGAYAVHCAYERWRETSDADRPSDFVVTCTSDGNHGASVAVGARNRNIRCIIYLPTVVSENRANSIARLGAEIVRIDGSYDDVARKNSADAAANGWSIITDTCPDQDCPESVADVMAGYRILGQEILDEWDELQPTHVVLQAGCGGMAASLVGHILTRMSLNELPRIVIAEPVRAACLQASAAAGKPADITDDLDTLMNGLSVGEVSLPAWEILYGTVSDFISFSDDYVAPAMRLFGIPDADQTPITSGETGAAGLAGLLSLVDDPSSELAIGLDSASRVLVINTEGDTDPDTYAALMATRT